ncbi:MAG: hypothetical protein KA184_23405 [Candidatus Hydrogenedentes bacterium]|nr:hypothetical protein [Candidatus Hydrogenedentota bacterium]
MKHLRRISLGHAQTGDTQDGNNTFRQEFILRLIIALVALFKSDFPI